MSSTPPPRPLETRSTLASMRLETAPAALGRNDSVSSGAEPIPYTAGVLPSSRSPSLPAPLLPPLSSDEASAGSSGSELPATSGFLSFSDPFTVDGAGHGNAAFSRQRSSGLGKAALSRQRSSGLGKRYGAGPGGEEDKRAVVAVRRSVDAPPTPMRSPSKETFVFRSANCEPAPAKGTAVGADDDRRRDIGTEMTPLGPLVPYAGSGSGMDISELVDCHLAKLDLGARFDAGGVPPCDKRGGDCQWEDDDRAKSCIRYQRKEVGFGRGSKRIFPLFFVFLGSNVREREQLVAPARS